MRSAILLLAAPFLLSAQSPEQLFRDRRYDEARAAFEEQLAKDKKDANALYYMGRIAEVQGRSGEAVDWYEKAVKLNDTSAVYHFWLGSALGAEAQKASKLRQPFLARRVKTEFERAVQLDPKMLDPRFGLVDFYTMAPGFMGGSMEKAKEQAAEIAKLNPMRGHLANAQIAERQKDQVTAEREYRAAVSAAPDSARPHYSLGGWYRRQNRWDDAFATYDDLMKAKPDEVAAHAWWGMIAGISGRNLERGERELQYWLANAPKDAVPSSYSFVRYWLGQIYEKTARKELAKTEYAEAVKLNPQNRDAKKALDALK